MVKIFWRVVTSAKIYYIIILSKLVYQAPGNHNRTGAEYNIQSHIIIVILYSTIITDGLSLLRWTRCRELQTYGTSAATYIV